MVFAIVALALGWRTQGSVRVGDGDESLGGGGAVVRVVVGVVEAGEGVELSVGYG